MVTWSPDLLHELLPSKKEIRGYPRKVHSHVTQWKWWTENNSKFLYRLTGSTSQDLRTVHIWIVWGSAAQPVERIYTRYAAKPLNNKETYLPLDYYNTNLRKFVLINAAPQSEIFHKDLGKKLSYFGNLLPNKTMEKRKGNSRNTCSVEHFCHELKKSQVDWSLHPKMRRTTLNLMDALYIF